MYNYKYVCLSVYLMCCVYTLYYVSVCMEISIDARAAQQLSCRQSPTIPFGATPACIPLIINTKNKIFFSL